MSVMEGILENITIKSEICVHFKIFQNKFYEVISIT